MRKFQLNDGTAWQTDGNTLRLSNLFGNLPCAEQTGGLPCWIGGSFHLSASNGNSQQDPFILKNAQAGGTSARFELQSRNGSLRLHTDWTLCPQTGILTRTDRLTNEADTPVTIFRCLPRFSLFDAEGYEVYGQGSRWCHESQGRWMPMQAGDLVLRCQTGRTTQEGTPYVCIRKRGDSSGVVLHVVPWGDWTIRLSLRTLLGRPPYLVVEAGLADDELRRELAPRETLLLPQILLQALPDGEPHMAAPSLHTFFQDACGPRRKPHAPVVYNTWFYEFSILDKPRLRRQLKAAKEIGCEVFTVDAGWYGQGENWAQHTGDWREFRKGAFGGRMRDFADEVRKAGLGFGLWMEPERVALTAPARQEHPEWFIPVDAQMARIDLLNPAACAWIRSEILRLIETYKLVWMKVDFNFELGYDERGTVHEPYARAWYGLLDEIRALHPRLFLEGCASGGMRLDLNSLTHFDGQFLSDSVDPTDVLRIFQGSLLRLPPGRMALWTVLRNAGRVIPEYGKATDSSQPVVLTPFGPVWEPCRQTKLTLAVCVGMLGMLGFSGDLAGLEPNERRQILDAVTLYKKWRTFITAASAHLLTPPQPIEQRDGWIGFQYQSPGRAESLVYIFNLHDHADSRKFRLRTLNPETPYDVLQILPASGATRRLTGQELQEEGVDVSLPARDACLLLVRPRPVRRRKTASAD